MCTLCNQLDTSRTDAFGERLLDVLNQGALALLLSIGHRTGLFDAMEHQPPSTSAAIANAANLNERYVREWLGGLLSLAQPGGMGLGTMWGRQRAEKMLRDTGFQSIEIKRLAHDFQNDYYIVRHTA